MKTQLNQNEEVIIVVRKHWIVLVIPFILSFIALFVLAVALFSGEISFSIIVSCVVFIWLLYLIIERKTNLWIVTNLRIIAESGVISINSKETPLDKINNVTYRQSILGRVLGFGNINIQSAAEFGSSNRMLIEKPKLLKDTITQCQENYKNKQAPILSDVVSIKNTAVETDISEQINKLHELKEKGIITEDDFQKGKNMILN